MISKHIEVSNEGKDYKTVVDKSRNSDEQNIEFGEIAPVRARWVRITVKGTRGHLRHRAGAGDREGMVRCIRRWWPRAAGGASAAAARRRSRRRRGCDTGATAPAAPLCAYPKLPNHTGSGFRRRNEGRDLQMRRCADGRGSLLPRAISGQFGSFRTRTYSRRIPQAP